MCRYFCDILWCNHSKHKIKLCFIFTILYYQYFITIFRFNFSTADSSNSVQICYSVGLHDVVRLEVSTRYLITFKNFKNVNNNQFEALAAPLHDRMTQCIYTKANLPRHSFNEGLPKDLEPWYVVPLQTEGRDAMEHVNKKLGKL